MHRAGLPSEQNSGPSPVFTQQTPPQATPLAHRSQFPKLSQMPVPPLQGAPGLRLGVKKQSTPSHTVVLQSMTAVHVRQTPPQPSSAPPHRREQSGTQGASVVVVVVVGAFSTQIPDTQVPAWLSAVAQAPPSLSAALMHAPPSQKPTRQAVVPDEQSTPAQGSGDATHVPPEQVPRWLFAVVQGPFSLTLTAEQTPPWQRPNVQPVLRFEQSTPAQRSADATQAPDEQVPGRLSFVAQRPPSLTAVRWHAPSAQLPSLQASVRDEQSTPAQRSTGAAVVVVVVGASVVVGGAVVVVGASVVVVVGVAVVVVVVGAVVVVVVGVAVVVVVVG